MALGIYNGIVSDNAQNRVLLPVSNSKSLAFDGSDDHLTTAADSTLATKTYSWWSQSADTSLNVVFDHGSANKGGFMFNGSSGRPLLYLADNYYRYFDDTSCQDDGSFHHWMLLLTTDVSNSRLFCDGVEVSADSTSTSDGAGLAYSTGIRLGRGGSYYFSGHLDEFAIFDGDKTGIVADLYNNGVPTDLSGTAGLEHWWRMGDATEPAADGTDDLIFDQQDKTLGSELITNGDFASDISGWTKSGDAASTIEWDGGKLKVTAATNYDGASQSVSGLVAGQKYKFSAEYELGTATQLQIRAGSEPSTDLSSPSSGTAVNYFTASGTSMTIYVRTGGSTGTIFFNNVSIKKINGATATMANMASSDIVQYTPNSHILSDLGIAPDLAVSMTRKLVSDYSADLYATSGSDITAIFDQSDGSLGSELLTGFTNGSTYPFDTFAASGTSITSAIETSGNWGGAASNSFSVTSGEVYKVTFDLTYNSGSDTLRVVFADNANGAATQRSNIYYTNSNGVNTAYLTASATDETAYLQIGTWHSSDVVNFSASNISVKKVNGKHLTNYDHADVGNDAQLSGSGNSARATFSSVDNTVLTTSTLGSAFPAGNHDVFMVFDPVGTDQQILFGRASTGGDFLAMDNGSSSDAASGITIGEIRVNDTILPATVSRDELWDAMTVSGTMGGLNVLSLEDVDLSSIGGDIRLGATNNTWRLEGAFAEFIITPPLTDAEHSAVVENIRAHYDAP